MDADTRAALLNWGMTPDDIDHMTPDEIRAAEIMWTHRDGPLPIMDPAVYAAARSLGFLA